MRIECLLLGTEHLCWTCITVYCNTASIIKLKGFFFLCLFFVFFWGFFPELETLLISDVVSECGFAQS